MILLELFRKNRECLHSKVSPESEIKYCPDCGELIENQWFISRCACCGVKLKTFIKGGEVAPQNKFCHNCGSKSFVVERLPKINFVDIEYAVLVKTVVHPSVQDCTQSWVEVKTSSCKPKLLQQFQ